MVLCLVTLTELQTHRAGLSASAELLVYFFAAKDDGDGDDNWSYKTFKAPNHHQQQMNTHFYMPDARSVAQPTVSEH